MPMATEAKERPASRFARLVGDLEEWRVEMSPETWSFAVTRGDLVRRLRLVRVSSDVAPRLVRIDCGLVKQVPRWRYGQGASASVYRWVVEQDGRCDPARIETALGATGGLAGAYEEAVSWSVEALSRMRRRETTPGALKGFEDPLERWLGYERVPVRPLQVALQEAYREGGDSLEEIARRAGLGGTQLLRLVGLMGHVQRRHKPVLWADSCRYETASRIWEGLGRDPWEFPGEGFSEELGL